jgi:chromate transporter
MIKKELVEEERWISIERFNRALGVYQVLPGPEAHELCVYFGMLARGRLGAILAGLGFMLPGFVLMFLLSWMYVTFGIRSSLFAATFLGLQAAVVALIVRAVHRIGRHAVTDRWLWGIAVAAFAADLLGVHFALTLAFGGLAHLLLRRRRFVIATACGVLFMAAAIASALTLKPESVVTGASTRPANSPSHVALLGYGFKSGMLTFGGAYTVIPFLQQDAVVVGGWMTNDQFLDGIALSGVLPAPLIIFSTVVGYLGGGPMGALALTLGIFLPAFSFTLIGHEFFERITRNEKMHALLDGVTAGVVGLIAATTVGLLRAGISTPYALGIFAGALWVLYRWHSKAAVPAVILGAGALGLALFFR